MYIYNIILMRGASQCFSFHQMALQLESLSRSIMLIERVYHVNESDVDEHSGGQGQEPFPGVWVAADSCPHVQANKTGGRGTKI